MYPFLMWPHDIGTESPALQETRPSLAPSGILREQTNLRFSENTQQTGYKHKKTVFVYEMAREGSV